MQGTCDERCQFAMSETEHLRCKKTPFLGVSDGFCTGGLREDKGEGRGMALRAVQRARRDMPTPGRAGSGAPPLPLVPPVVPPCTPPGNPPPIPSPRLRQGSQTGERFGSITGRGGTLRGHLGRGGTALLLRTLPTPSTLTPVTCRPVAPPPLVPARLASCCRRASPHCARGGVCSLPHGCTALRATPPSIARCVAGAARSGARVPSVLHTAHAPLRPRPACAAHPALGWGSPRCGGAAPWPCRGA